jgi:plastocyanin
MKLPALALALLSLLALVPPPGASAPLALDASLLPDAPLDNAMGVAAADLRGLGPATGPLEEAVPRAPGTLSQLQLTYGPFVVPPGHDLNRVVVDVPLRGGFVTAFHYRLVDVATGAFPTNMELHIHHALWFRVDPARPGLFQFDQLLFGTGEERTDIDLDARSDAVPGWPRLGIPFAAHEGQNLVLMLHNKQPVTRAAWLVLDVRFLHGSAADIAAAEDCANPIPLPSDVACFAGAQVHRVLGRLWGAIFHVPRGSGTYVYPPGWGTQVRYTAAQDGTLVAAWGHVHPQGRETIIANLGSASQPCGDLDGDGVPGITLLRSRKWDRNPLAWPHSEEFQMGGAQAGFRAPVRAGDRIVQFGVYDNALHAQYYQMTFAATHVDVDAPPAPRVGGCSRANTGPTLLGGGDPTASVLNRPWEGPPLPLCGQGLGPACDLPASQPAQGVAAASVIIAGFAYLPGDGQVGGPLGAPVRVAQGQSLQFVNADWAALVRHSVTSCPWPCNGPYKANYPLPDGTFDSGNMGNVDLFNGEGLETDPTWTLPGTLQPGLYSYYCRLHPGMRGALEVVPS